MKVQIITLMLHLLHWCSMYDSSTPKTTIGLHAEIPDEIPRTETSEDKITLPGLIAVICTIIIIVITSVCCCIKKFCWSTRQSASIEVSQTVSRERLSVIDTNPAYAVQVYRSWSLPVYPYTARDISQSSQPGNILPPRYSSIFDDNGREIEPANL